MNPIPKLITTAALLLIPSLASATDIQPILQTNQPLSDGSGDLVLDMIYSSIDMSRNGDIAIRCRSYDPSSPLYPYEQNDYSLLLWSAGALHTVIRAHDPIGDDGYRVRYVGYANLSPDGRYLIAFAGADRSEPHYSDSYYTYLQNRTTDPGHFVPLTNSQDPFVNNAQVNNTGNIAASVSFSNFHAILTGPVGQFQPLISPATPLPHDDTAVDSHVIAINAASQTLFTAVTDANSPGAAGVYLGAPGNIQPIAVRNDPAPGIPNAWFSDIQQPRGLSDDGRTAFAAAVVGPGLRTTNDQGIWVASPNSLHLLAREGDLVPGTAQHFTSFSNPSISANGHVAFLGDYTLKSPDQQGPVTDSLWMTDPTNADQLAKVAAIGDPAPGIPGTFDKIYQFALSDTGFIAFLATVQLPDNDPYGFPLTATGLWLGHPGDLHLLLRDGDPLPVDLDGQPSYAALLSLASASSYSSDPLRITDDGRVLVDIVYRNADNTAASDGLFLLSLPEPTPLALTFLTLLPLLSRRRLRR